MNETTRSCFIRRRNAEEKGSSKENFSQKTSEEKSVKDKIIETVVAEDKAKALQVYDDLSAYTPLTVDKQGRLTQDGTVIEDSNLVDLIAHDVKKKRKDKNSPLLGKYFLLQRSKSSPRKDGYHRVVEKEVK